MNHLSYMRAQKESVASQRRLSVVFDGHVQGVGFRFSVIETARRHPVVGFVRNEPDGTVRVVAEGAEESLLRFLDSLRAMGVYRFVRGERVQWSPGTGEFHQFEIRYG